MAAQLWHDIDVLKRRDQDGVSGDDSGLLIERVLAASHQPLKQSLIFANWPAVAANSSPATGHAGTVQRALIAIHHPASQDDTSSHDNDLFVPADLPPVDTHSIVDVFYPTTRVVKLWPLHLRWIYTMRLVPLSADEWTQVVVVWRILARMIHLKYPSAVFKLAACDVVRVDGPTSRGLRAASERWMRFIISELRLMAAAGSARVPLITLALQRITILHGHLLGRRYHDTSFGRRLSECRVNLDQLVNFELLRSDDCTTLLKVQPNVSKGLHKERARDTLTQWLAGADPTDIAAGMRVTRYTILAYIRAFEEGFIDREANLANTAFEDEEDLNKAVTKSRQRKRPAPRKRTREEHDSAGDGSEHSGQRPRVDGASPRQDSGGSSSQQPPFSGVMVPLNPTTYTEAEWVAYYRNWRAQAILRSASIQV